MMTIAELPDDVLGAIRAHAAACYPSECCGVIFIFNGSAAASPCFPAYQFYACRNVDENPQHGFRVGGLDMDMIAGFVRSGHRVGAIYHSHIDQPATFSERDRHFAKAWPLTLHLVFAVTKEGVIAQHAYNSLGDCVDEPVMETA